MSRVFSVCVVAVLCAAATALLAGDGRAAASAFTVRDLGQVPTLGGTFSTPEAVNAAGQVVGTSQTAGGEQHGFWWAPGAQIVDLGPNTYVTAISDAGRVVGIDSTSGAPQAFSWTPTDGKVAIGSIGSDSWPRAVNELGQVVGVSTVGPVQAPFSWTASGGIRALPTLPGGAVATGLSDTGWIVGFGASLTSDLHALVWPNTGGLVDLGQLAHAGISTAAAVNGAGQVVGTADGRAFSWTQAGGIRDLGAPAGSTSSAWDVNTAGDVVGLWRTGSSADWHVYRWTQGNGMTDLGTVPGTPDRLTIDDGGTIVGWTQGTTFGAAFAWTQLTGLVLLDSLNGRWSEAFTTNAHGGIVGVAGDATDAAHAVLWHDASATRQEATVVIDYEPPCLNPYDDRCNTYWANPIAELVLPGAFRERPDYTFEPMLVDRVDVSTSPVFALTYHVRADAMWNDGVPVGADDLVFTWNAAAGRPGYAAISRAVTIDSKTVRFEFSSPYAAWRALFPAILPEHVLEGRDLTHVWDRGIVDPATGRAIGSGPYLFGTWAPGQWLQLVRNARWWGTYQPSLSLLKFIFATDSSTEIQALVGGSADVMYPVISSQLSSVVGRPGITTEAGASEFVEQLLFNVTGGSSPLLHNDWFRQAVAWGLDRSVLADSVFGTAIGSQVPALQNLLYGRQQGPYVPHFSDYTSSWPRVASLMNSHGCIIGNDSVWECGGQRAAFTITYTSTNATRANEVALIRTQLGAVDIEVTGRPVDPSVIFGPTGIPSGDFDAALFGWVLDGDPSTWTAVYSCNGTANYGHYCNETVDDRLARADTEPDDAARAALVNEADARLAIDVPALPLFQRPTFLAYTSELHGVVENSSPQSPLWNAEQWRGASSTLTVSRSGTGSGTIVSAPAGIDCGSSCSTVFADSTHVTLTAVPAAGSSFAGWLQTPGCTGTGTCTVTLAGNRYARAIYNTTPGGGGSTPPPPPPTPPPPTPPPPPPSSGGGGGGGIAADIGVTGSVVPTTAEVGATLTYLLTVRDVNNGPAVDLRLLADLPTGVNLVSAKTTRGSGCTVVDRRVDCFLGWLSSDVPETTVEITVHVTEAGPLSLKAWATALLPDPVPANNSVTLVANQSAPAPPPSPPIKPIVKPVFGAAKLVPSARAGRHVVFTLRVNRSDTLKPLTSGSLVCDPSIRGVVIRHAEQFRGGVVQLAFTVPKTAKGKLLKIRVTIRAAGGGATKILTYPIR